MQNRAVLKIAPLSCAGGNMRKIVGWMIVTFLAAASPLPAQKAAATKAIALRCGALFDARSESVQKNVVVVIEGEKVKSVGTSAPADADVIDLSRETCLPGLMDTH